jgi:DNA-binding response OmpR family regulator
VNDLILLMQKHILLVDDDQDFIDLYSQVLSIEFRISAVKSLKQCLTYLKENPYEVDLILCDIFMPEADGFEVYEYLKSKKEYAFYPIVFKTSSLNEDVMNKCILGKGAELISTLMTNHEILARMKKEIKNSNLIKIMIDNTVKMLIDKKQGTVIFPDTVFQLYFTRNELEILSILSCTDKPVLREVLVKDIYGETYIVTDNNLNTVLSGIRKKIATFQLNIKSIRGQGVILCPL